MTEHKEIMSMTSSRLNDEQLLEKRKNEKYAYFLGILAQVFWGINGVHMKSIRLFFKEYYTDNTVVFWRFIPVTLFGYYLGKYNGAKVLRHSEIQHLKWFLVRNATSYIFIMCWTRMYLYFRAATVSVICQTNPLVVVLFSVCLIGEKFYIRYLIGIFLCIFGSAIIIFNDKKPQSTSTILDDNVFAGICFGIGNVVLCGLSIIGQKVLTKDGMEANLQNFYFGLYNLVPSFVICLFSGYFGLNIGYLLYSALNGFFFYMGNYLTSLAFKYIAASKFQPITYLSIVFTFIFSFIFLGEPVYFMDAIGASIIIGFQYYNMQYPPGRTINKNNVTQKEKESSLIQENN